MKIFVGLSYNSHSNVNDYRGLFLTHEAAQKKLGDNASIVQHSVQGIYEYPKTIFVASRYISGPDLFDFVGLFADYDSAAQAAGNRCHILSVNPPQN